jgi:phosphatidylserine decarboxylase
MPSVKGMSPVQTGFWIPGKRWATEKYLKPFWFYMQRQREAGLLKPMLPVIRDFKAWTTGSAVHRMLTVSMINTSNDYVRSISKKTRKAMHGVGDTLGMGSYDTFFEVLNELIQTSPGFNKTEMVGVPISAYLTVGMSTQPGIALFADAEYNKQLRKVLNAWNEFLRSPASLDKLDIKDPEKPGSWISKAAFEAGVWKDVKYSPSKPAFGFTSWDAFFLRPFVRGARPFHGDEDKVVCLGTESTPWAYSKSLQFMTDFWIKDVNYSLLDIFAGQEKWARLFEGGQGFQSFLSATHFHRWISPLTGLIVRSWRQQGTYFAQRPGQPQTPGSWAGTIQQPYLAETATRAIIVFKHPRIGYVGMVLISMGEVGTCAIDADLKVKEGERPVRITRGEQIGAFHFGGSTCLMLFQKGKVSLAKWAKEAPKHRNDKWPQKIGTVLATLKK